MIEDSKLRFSNPVIPIALCFWLSLVSDFAQADDLPESLNLLIENHCADCHDYTVTKGGLDLFALDWDLNDPHISSRWVKVHDQIASGEMPPKKKSKLEDTERQAVLADLAREITETQETKAKKNGRSVSRRVNRFEYENILRDLLHDPYLKIADRIPLDGEVHGFAKVAQPRGIFNSHFLWSLHTVTFHWMEAEGPIIEEWPPASYRALFGDLPFKRKPKHVDVSHVQVDAYLDVAEFEPGS